MSIGQWKLKLLSRNWISIFRNSDLDIDLSDPKLPLDVSYAYAKFGVNRPNQTQVIEQKPKVDARLPAHRLRHYNNQFSLKNLFKNSAVLTFTFFNNNQYKVIYKKNNHTLETRKYLEIWVSGNCLKQWLGRASLPP